jgi:hypothetical protein
LAGAPPSRGLCRSSARRRHARGERVESEAKYARAYQVRRVDGKEPCIAGARREPLLGMQRVRRASSARGVPAEGRLEIGGVMGANGRRRVVITGLGAVTPLAGEIATCWERLIGGHSAAAAINAFDASGFPVRVACEAKEFDPARWIEYGQARRMDRVAQLVVAAARQAEVDSGIEIEGESDRVGASVATAMGGMKAFEDWPRCLFL